MVEPTCEADAVKDSDFVEQLTDAKVIATFSCRICRVRFCTGWAALDHIVKHGGWRKHLADYCFGKEGGDE